MQRCGGERHIGTGRARRLSRWFRAHDGAFLAGGNLGPDGGHVLVKLSGDRHTAGGDPVEGCLPDMPGQPESGRGQRRSTFCHIMTILAIHDYLGQSDPSTHAPETGLLAQAGGKQTLTQAAADCAAALAGADG